MSLQSKALSTPVSHSEWQGNDASSQPRTTASIELQVVLMRVEESLSHIKDIVHEITFSSPISGLKAAHTLKVILMHLYLVTHRFFCAVCHRLRLPWAPFWTLCPSLLPSTLFFQLLRDCLRITKFLQQ